MKEESSTISLLVPLSLGLVYSRMLMTHKINLNAKCLVTCRWRTSARARTRTHTLHYTTQDLLCHTVSGKSYWRLGLSM